MPADSAAANPKQRFDTPPAPSREVVLRAILETLDDPDFVRRNPKPAELEATFATFGPNCVTVGGFTVDGVDDRAMFLLQPIFGQQDRTDQQVIPTATYGLVPNPNTPLAFVVFERTPGWAHEPLQPEKDYVHLLSLLRDGHYGSSINEVGVRAVINQGRRRELHFSLGYRHQYTTDNLINSPRLARVRFSTGGDVALATQLVDANLPQPPSHS